jgi:hypothetical protein
VRVFEFRNPKPLLEGALQVDLGIAAPSRNVRHLRDWRLRRPARAAAGATNGWLIPAQQFVA